MVGNLLHLQRSAGNAATVAFVQRLARSASGAPVQRSIQVSRDDDPNISLPDGTVGVADASGHVTPVASDALAVPPTKASGFATSTTATGSANRPAGVGGAEGQYGAGLSRNGRELVSGSGGGQVVAGSYAAPNGDKVSGLGVNANPVGFSVPVTDGVSIVGHGPNAAAGVTRTTSATGAQYSAGLQANLGDASLMVGNQTNNVRAGLSRGVGAGLRGGYNNNPDGSTSVNAGLDFGIFTGDAKVTSGAMNYGEPLVSNPQVDEMLGDPIDILARH